MLITAIILLLLIYTIYTVVKLEQKVGELQDEIHALHHSLDLETEILKNKISYIEENGKTL